ncbi:MAG TPA: K(+)-transporting ATPase subunit C [Saprospiraceae bacterium]|nr:K(+)-transporting ATPase subunit C [Saprospiraceae bacterium]
MKTHLLPAIKLTLVCIVFFVGVYTAVVWGIGQVIAPNHGKGEKINYNDSNDGLYGFANIGQSFTSDNYFWSRPSAVGYNAAGSGASNKGPTNQEYLDLVQARLDSFIVHNPSLKKSDVPVEMITASGSGLDPHISPQSAMIQVDRIAQIRNISKDKIVAIVNEHTEEPLLGLFGPSRINVLKLNIALDHLK